MEAEKRRKLIDTLKKNKYILLIVLVGAVLILWPTGSKSTSSKASDSSPNEPVYSLADTETKLQDLLSQIDGAGKVEVMLTLKSSTERVVAKDTQNSETQSDDNGTKSSETNSTVTTVILSGNGEDDALTLVYLYPEYLGAVVIAQGGGNVSVRLQLTEAVAAATGLGSDKISVIKMKGS